MKTIVFVIGLVALAEVNPLFLSRDGNISLECAVRGENCSTKACCDYSGLGAFNLGPLYCFQFGFKVCKTYRSIPNRREYFRLLDQVNSTNYYEMRNRYWLSLLPIPTIQSFIRSPSRILRFG